MSSTSWFIAVSTRQDQTRWDSRRLRSRLDALRNRRLDSNSTSFIVVIRLDEFYCRHQTRRVILSSSDLDSDLMKLHRVEYFLIFLLFLVLLFVSLFSRMKEISLFAFAWKLIVSTLTSTTYNVWIIEMKNIVVRFRVEEYVNSKELKSESLMFKYSRFFDFVKIVLVSILVYISTSTQDKYRLSAFATTVINNVSSSLILITVIVGLGFEQNLMFDSRIGFRSSWTNIRLMFNSRTLDRRVRQDCSRRVYYSKISHIRKRLN
jgi:hypothetical protein